MSSQWIVHCIATCQDCGKQWEDYLTARKQASAHHKQTGHNVRGEVGYAFKYGESGE
jgi:hypothetical protein